jgi:hypothetical protein
VTYTAIVTHREGSKVLKERAKAASKDEAKRLAKKRLLLAYPHLKDKEVSIYTQRTTA